MRWNLIIVTCCLMFALASPLKASPYCDINLSTGDGEARWGVWRVCDVAPDDYNYMGDGDDVEFKTYWFVGFGRYLIIRVSQGAALCLIGVTLLAVAVVFYLRRKRNAQPAHAGDE